MKIKNIEKCLNYFRKHSRQCDTLREAEKELNALITALVAKQTCPYSYVNYICCVNDEDFPQE
jgi:hypothetical protein